MEHSLALSATLDIPAAEKMFATLRRVPGVRAVEAPAGSSRVHVQFDDDLTSPQEISSTVARAGFPLLDVAPSPGQCCGFCSGL
jgi:copper chaperone CopZ